MNYEVEAKEILNCCIKEDSEKSAKALIMSILEFSDSPGTTFEETRQLLWDMWHELGYHETKETEDSILEVGSNGVFDS